MVFQRPKPGNVLLHENSIILQLLLVLLWVVRKHPHNGSSEVVHFICSGCARKRPPKPHDSCTSLVYRSGSVSF